MMFDWQYLALQLRRHYGPLHKASCTLGKHKGWLSQIARGEVAEPKFSDGLRLMDFAYDHLPDEIFQRIKNNGTNNNARA